MLLDIFRYLKSRVAVRDVVLKNFVDKSSEHGKRTSEPSVSIIIPTRDKFELLSACVESIIEKTTYENYRLVVVNNDSTEAKTLGYLSHLESRGVLVLDFPHKFNYSEICNFAAAGTMADFLCFLNNDTEITEPGWLGLMMDHAVQPSVGVVGSKLTFAEGSIQHLGIALGHAGLAGHAYAGLPVKDARLDKVSSACFEVSAVTFACAVVSRDLYLKSGGLNEDFKVGLNDVDFCLRLNSLGRKSIVCGKSCLVHHESKSRPSMKSLKGATRAIFEVVRFLKIHPVAEREEAYFEVRLPL